MGPFQPRGGYAGPLEEIQTRNLTPSSSGNPAGMGLLAIILASLISSIEGNEIERLTISITRMNMEPDWQHIMILGFASMLMFACGAVSMRLLGKYIFNAFRQIAIIHPHEHNRQYNHEPEPLSLRHTYTRPGSRRKRINNPII